MAVIVYSASYIAQVTVATAGVSVQLHSTLNVPAVYLKADSGNSGIVYVGDSTVSAGRYIENLLANESMEISSDDPLGEVNITTVYLDASTASQSVHASRLT